MLRLLENDAAVLKARGRPIDFSEPEIVSGLFDMYAKLTEGKEWLSPFS